MKKQEKRNFLYIILGIVALVFLFGDTFSTVDFQHTKVLNFTNYNLVIQSTHPFGVSGSCATTAPDRICKDYVVAGSATESSITLSTAQDIQRADGNPTPADDVGIQGETSQIDLSQLTSISFNYIISTSTDSISGSGGVAELNFGNHRILTAGAGKSLSGIITIKDVDDQLIVIINGETNGYNKSTTGSLLFFASAINMGGTSQSSKIEITNLQFTPLSTSTPCSESGGSYINNQCICPPQKVLANGICVLPNTSEFNWQLYAGIAVGLIVLYFVYRELKKKSKKR